MRIIFSFIGLVAVLLIAYTVDISVELLRKRGADTFTLSPQLWLVSCANLIFAAALLLLAYYVIYRAHLKRLIGMVFFIIGLLGSFATPLIFSTSLELPRFLSMGILDILAPNSRMVYACAFLSVTGMAALVNSKLRAA
jgi:hypothetical protein